MQKTPGSKEPSVFQFQTYSELLGFGVFTTHSKTTEKQPLSLYIIEPSPFLPYIFTINRLLSFYTKFKTILHIFLNTP